MPIHDWTRLHAGEFHAFHNVWIGELQRALNSGILPPDYYALGEQVAGEIVPDVLTLHASRSGGVSGTRASPLPSNGVKAIAVAERPPQTRLTQQLSTDALYSLTKQRAVVIRHVSDDKIVAIIEIVSPGNKHSRPFLEQLINKILAALVQSCHLLVVDLFPPGHHDPDGIHAIIKESMTGESFTLPTPQSRTVVSYCASAPVTAYVELPDLGEPLPAMPLFLSSGEYVSVPLEETYQAAWPSMPAHLRQRVQ